MEYNSQTGVLQCNFNYMQLRRIKRNSDRKSTEIVMEEKFTILFRSKFTIPGDELDIPVMCQSLPVVVIVHVTQQPAAEATIFWDNSFAEPNREPFVVPEVVSWPRVSEALNHYFQTISGRGLTPRNLDYLGRKLLGV
ncbi:PREDICTED: signal transducer and activator of transcription 5B-like, partial [Amphimedon queenslandica]